MFRTTNRVRLYISVSGQTGIEGWYRGGVTLTLTASDDVSGVAGIEYSLDGGQTWQGYAGPFTLSREGIYAIMHRSRDRAGMLRHTVP